MHLLDWPKYNEEKRNKQLEEDFEWLRKVEETLLALRAENKLRLRWVLKEGVVSDENAERRKPLAQLLERTCNVKHAYVNQENPEGNYAHKLLDKTRVFLSLDTEGLEDDWKMSELVRKVQNERKKQGFQQGEQAKLELPLNMEETKFLQAHRKEVEEKTNTQHHPTPEKLLKK